MSDLYLIHQQGWEGAAEHISQPDRIAWKSMCATSEGREKGEKWCRRAIWGNTLPAVKDAWKSVDKLTSEAFVGMWRERVADFYSKYMAPPPPNGRTSKFPLSGWQELPHPRAERGPHRRCGTWCRSSLNGRARDALYVVNDALGSFLLRANEVIDQVPMSASLIGPLGSSTFRLSANAVLMSLAGSCFSSESAPGPFHHGIRGRGGTIFWTTLPSV